jgi:hypothetical protein
MFPNEDFFPRRAEVLDIQLPRMPGIYSVETSFLGRFATVQQLRGRGLEARVHPTGVQISSPRPANPNT